MKIQLLLLCSAFYLTTLAQENTTAKQFENKLTSQSDTTIHLFTKVKVMPKFDGGMQEFYQEVNNNLKYPKEAKRAGITGRVYLSFVVELNGSISNIKVMRKLGYGCDEAATAAVQGLLFAEPAYHDGKPVRMRLNMPVNFKL